MGSSLWKLCVTRLAAITAALGVALPAVALETKQLKVVGTWGNLTLWERVEKPFWGEQIPEASKGQITADARPITELGLNGFEVMRMLRLGLFDVAHGIVGYLGADPVAEGVDIASVMQDFGTARRSVDAYRSILADRMDKVYGARLLAVYPNHIQWLYCNKPIHSIESLKGLKIRSYSKSISDMISGLGGTAVTLAFAEVGQALQLGTINCGLTGNAGAYTASWHEVATHVYKLGFGYGFAYMVASNNTWAKLDEETRSFLVDQAQKREDMAWKLVEQESAVATSCLTGRGSVRSVSLAR